MSNLRAIRRRLSMTQSELGSALGVTQGAVSFYEAGRLDLPVRAASALIVLARERNLALTFDDIYAVAGTEHPGAAPSESAVANQQGVRDAV